MCDLAAYPAQCPRTSLNSRLAWWRRACHRALSLCYRFTARLACSVADCRAHSVRLAHVSFFADSLDSFYHSNCHCYFESWIFIIIASVSGAVSAVDWQEKVAEHATQLQLFACHRHHLHGCCEDAVASSPWVLIAMLVNVTLSTIVAGTHSYCVDNHSHVFKWAWSWFITKSWWSWWSVMTESVRQMMPTSTWAWILYCYEASQKTVPSHCTITPLLTLQLAYTCPTIIVIDNPHIYYRMLIDNSSSIGMTHMTTFIKATVAHGIAIARQL